MDAKITWKQKMSFSGTADTGFTLPIGTDQAVGGDDDGFKPLELILLGLAGCTGMDVISILQKKRQVVTNFEVKVHADRQEEHPKVFTRIMIEYLVTGQALDPAAVERAVELSETKYCPAQAMLAKSVVMERKIVLKEG
jgi:putative redox protein